VLARPDKMAISPFDAPRPGARREGPASVAAELFRDRAERPLQRKGGRSSARHSHRACLPARSRWPSEGRPFILHGLACDRDLGGMNHPQPLPEASSSAVRGEALAHLWACACALVRLCVRRCVFSLQKTPVSVYFGPPTGAPTIAAVLGARPKFCPIGARPFPPSAQPDFKCERGAALIYRQCPLAATAI